MEKDGYKCTSIQVRGGGGARVGLSWVREDECLA